MILFPGEDLKQNTILINRDSGGNEKSLYN